MQLVPVNTISSLFFPTTHGICNSESAFLSIPHFKIFFNNIEVLFFDFDAIILHPTLIFL